MTTHDTLMALANDLVNKSIMFTKAFATSIKAERTTDANDAMDEARAALSAALADLIAERHANAKDAARYRWIREGDGDNQVMTYVVGLDDWTPWSCPEDVDAAIDTALKLGL